MRLEQESTPWLRRHVEAKRLAETVAKLKKIYVYEAEEIVSAVGQRYRRLRPRRPGKAGKIELELKRLETVYNVVVSRLRSALEMPPLSGFSDFHRALIEAYIGGEEYENARRRVARAIRLAREFWNQYRWLIATSETPREAARLRKEASGRILSLVRRLRKDLNLLRRVKEELVRTHVIAEGFPIVVIAGIPSSGKSTIVSKLSTAKPEIAAYPFTTKTIIVGKVSNSDVTYYIVDTPGVLERPHELLNEIERKALAALSTLPDVVLFVLDPSLESVQDVNSQIRLLKSIEKDILEKRDAKLMVVVNKTDITPRVDVQKAIEAVMKAINDSTRRKLCTEPIAVSAATGEGMDKLKTLLGECVKKAAPWLYGKG